VGCSNHGIWRGGKKPEGRRSFRAEGVRGRCFGITNVFRRIVEGKKNIFITEFVTTVGRVPFCYGGL
jgi:hypothetical protein